MVRKIKHIFKNKRLRIPRTTILLLVFAVMASKFKAEGMEVPEC